ncbi:MAG: hypothetical protein JNK15_18495, partial [Planctomycetes bacterium]|nr:hypothetical protein [Planctomycetota bacterium]
MSSPQNAPEPCPHGLRSTVPPAADGLALLDWLVRRFRYFDADGWSAQIAAGRVYVGTAAAGNATVVRTGDTIAFFPQVQRDAAAEVQVLFADADLVVVDKPPFLVVQSVGA